MELEVGLERGSEGFEERLSRLKIGAVKHLEVSHDYFSAFLACLLKAAGQQGGFSHLARAFDQHDAVLTRNGGAKLFVHRAYNVVFGVQRHDPDGRSQLSSRWERPGGRRILQGVEYLIHDALVICGTFPSGVLERI